METILRTTRKANKEHKCNYCFQKIEKGQTYDFSTHTYDGIIYNWKNHIHCSSIAGKLRMWDNCDEGLSGEDFCESIRIEYQNIMSEHYSKLYESKEFVYPKFPEQLKFVMDFHKIDHNL